MESNRKRSRGFLKGKLMPFYKAAKPSSSSSSSSSSSHLHYKPGQSSSSSPSSSPLSSTSTTGYYVQYHDYHNKVNYHHHRDHHQAKLQGNKVSLMVHNAAGDHYKLSQIENLFGVVGDESVDIKATSYIALMKERFRLQSERVKGNNAVETTS